MEKIAKVCILIRTAIMWFCFDLSLYLKFVHNSLTNRIKQNVITLILFLVIFVEINVTVLKCHDEISWNMQLILMQQTWQLMFIERPFVFHFINSVKVHAYLSSLKYCFVTIPLVEYHMTNNYTSVWIIKCIQHPAKLRSMSEVI